jgi:hypothetical protein
MSTTSKSPVAVARRALATVTAALGPYSHRFSPHRYTQSGCAAAARNVKPGNAVKQK